MILMLLLAMYPVTFPAELPVSLCTIDRCDQVVCAVETSTGVVDVIKKSWYVEGLKIICPPVDPKHRL
jgi:hypothetical protein